MVQAFVRMSGLDVTIELPFARDPLELLRYEPRIDKEYGSVTLDESEWSIGSQIQDILLVMASAIIGCMFGFIWNWIVEERYSISCRSRKMEDTVSDCDVRFDDEKCCAVILVN